MRFLDTSIKLIWHSILVIVAVIGLCAVVLVLSTRFIISTNYGLKDDRTLIENIPKKFEVENVLDKKADIWDGSCTVIVMQISEKSASSIIQNGLKFFDEQTREILKSNRNSYSLTLEPWKETPFSDEKFSKTEYYKDYFSGAMNCSNVSKNFQEYGSQASKERGSYYTVSLRSRTIYLMIPNKRILLITHYQ